jgi:hypothetical protein
MFGWLVSGQMTACKIALVIALWMIGLAPLIPEALVR